MTTRVAGIDRAAVARPMPVDVVTLIRRDHDDLDRALAAMVDPAAAACEQVSHLDALRIGFTAHAAAQTTVLRRVLDPKATPALLRAAMVTVIDEHREQARAIAALALLRPGSDSWLTRALELRVMLIDHATREELARASLTDHMPASVRLALAGGYATERLRRIGLRDRSVQRSAAARPWIFN